MVATQESSSLATTLVGQSCTKQRIRSGRLTLHADRGASMRIQGAGFTPGRSGGHEIPLTTSRARRQSLLGVAVQDPEIPSPIPAAVRFDSGRPGVLPGVLWLVQHRASPLGNRTAHARGRSLSEGGVQTPGADSGSTGRLCSIPRTVPQRTPCPAVFARSRLDQSPQPGGLVN